MSAYREVMRRKLLEELYDRMTPDEKRLFAQLTMQNKGRDEILQALQQNQQLADISKKVNSQSWLSDFSSNIAGNAVWDGLVWIASRLIKKL